FCPAAIAIAGTVTTDVVVPVAVTTICSEAPGAMLWKAVEAPASTFVAVGVPVTGTTAVTKTSKPVAPDVALTTRKPARPGVGVNMLPSVMNATEVPFGYATNVWLVPTASVGKVSAVAEPACVTVNVLPATGTLTHDDAVPNAMALAPVTAVPFWLSVSALSV